MKRCCWCLLWLALGCQDVTPAASSLVTDTTTATCSQMHRYVSQWKNAELDECGPDVSGLIELMPIGNDLLLARRRFSPLDDLWQMTPDGGVGLSTSPAPVNKVTEAVAAEAGFTLLPGSPPRVLVYDPRSPLWNLYTVFDAATAQSVFALVAQGSWLQGQWPNTANMGSQPWGQEFIGLENGYLLDRSFSDGSTQVWQITSDAGNPVQLVPSGSPAAGPNDGFTRGHRLVHLGPGRLLEWLPNSGSGSSVLPSCAGSVFNVWSYSLDSGAAFAPHTTGPPGCWPDIGSESDIVADDQHLFVWTRATGRLRSYVLDPTLADPLFKPPVVDSPNPSLISLDWNPPTAAPNITHLVLVLQDGRSFDSYFGNYCQGTTDADQPLGCVNGAACCGAIPATVPGASPAGCIDPESEIAFSPASCADCLRAEIDGGKMNGFAVAHPAVTCPGMPAAACGDPGAFACAATGAAGGAVTVYQGMAGGGALADRFFQTYGFTDGLARDAGGAGAVAPELPLTNLLYLVSTRFVSDPLSLFNRPLISKELVRLQVPWAIYAGPVYLPRMMLFGLPIFYDPDWSPFRSLNGGELAHDIQVGALPPVAVVLPDSGDPAFSETPGRPFDPAIDYVQSLVNLIAATPAYQGKTLVLLTYLTAGGFFDHVSPPPVPPLGVDASSGTKAEATAVGYGPRVPLLALGKLARPGSVSHRQLELSSITKFIEWNWLNGHSLKGERESDDFRTYRDTWVSNLGSLIDATLAGAPVPDGPN